MADAYETYASGTEYLSQILTAQLAAHQSAISSGSVMMPSTREEYIALMKWPALGLARFPTKGSDPQMIQGPEE